MILRGPPAPPPRHRTLVDALASAAWHASGATFVDRQERERFMPWREVWQRAGRAAAALATMGIRRGDRVAIVLRTEPAFLCAFFGTWLAGAVPVPLYPPVRLGRMDEYLASTERMIRVSGARLVISSGATRRLLGTAVARAHPELLCRDADELEEPPARILRQTGPDDLALVQFSSGSTVDPKPVALTHRALQAQVDALVQAIGPRTEDVLVSWLPLYHDMGLIGCLLGAMSYPGPLVLIPPELFLARPALWLRAIARHRGTISAAPSFAYAYCADRVKEAEMDLCSLASWRWALDGAEPVSGEAMRRFAARFEAWGFDPAAFVTAYGLSEAALGVTWSRRGAPLAVRRVDPVRLARSGEVVPASSGAGREVTSVGVPLAGVEVALRGEGGELAGEGRLGRIFVRTPSMMAGYLGDPSATAAVLSADGWLDTGDLGFAAGGELFVHGRAKDLVIIRGANHAPEEFEAALAGVLGLRPGCAVALGFLPAAGDGSEALLVLAERAREGAEEQAELEARVRRAVLERTGIAPHTVAVLTPGTLPRTSSGKLRRSEALRRFQDGTLAPPRRVTAIGLAIEAARSSLAYARARLRGPA